MASTQTGKLSKEDFRKRKELDDARKAGTAMPEIDSATGKSINPHIPQFMAQAPWYMDTGSGPSLKHHKGPEYNADPSKLEGRYERQKITEKVTKFRKGACPNCGGMHKLQDCLERPRKIGAKYTGNFAQDEKVISKRKDDYDSKRDRWDGYDPAMYQKVVEEHNALEEARRQIREEQIDKTTDLKTVEKVAKAGKGKKQKDDDDFGSSDESDDEDEARYAEGADAVGQKLDTKTRITVRNLRIREDTAKYLLNLNPESAHYDPKTRSMRENPNPEKEDAAFAGENFARHSGESVDVQKLHLFAWQSEQRGNDIHAHSNPTQAALVYQDFLKKKDKLKDTSKTSILDRYGGEEYLQKAPQELLSGQTESYVEYDRSGKLVRGQEKAKARSKYDEDVYPGNHSAIWGSWFNLTTFQWGYACCHSYVKQSYCAGAAGIQAEKDEAEGNNKMIMPPPSQQQTDNKSLADINKDKSASQREKERREYDEKADTKRKAEGELTEEDMEAYKRKRNRGFEDPLANVNSEELLPL